MGGGRKGIPEGGVSAQKSIPRAPEQGQQDWKFLASPAYLKDEPGDPSRHSKSMGETL